MMSAKRREDILYCADPFFPFLFYDYSFFQKEKFSFSLLLYTRARGGNINRTTKRR